MRDVCPSCWRVCNGGALTDSPVEPARSCQCAHGCFVWHGRAVCRVEYRCTDGRKAHAHVFTLEDRPMTTLEPCKAGFDGCDAMRAEAVRRHPRTPRLAECPHYAIPPERPEKLQGPAVGALCVYRNDRYPQWDGQTVEVTERSYVWSPGDRSQSRRYDLKVIRFVSTGKTMLVDDKNLTPVTL